MSKFRGNGYKLRNSVEFENYIRDNIVLDESNGQLHAYRISAAVSVTIQFNGKSVCVPYSYLVWFLKNKKWPNPTKQLDHIDDRPFNNKPSNLQEITQEENNAKRKGKNNKLYGEGKYGYGIQIYLGNKDKIYRARQYLRVEDETRKITGRKFIYVAKSKSLEILEERIYDYIRKMLSGPMELDEFI